MVHVKSDRSKARDSYCVMQLHDDKRPATDQKFPMSSFRHHSIEVQYQNLYQYPSLTPPPPLVNHPVVPSTSLRPDHLNQSTSFHPTKYTPESIDSDSDEEDFPSPVTSPPPVPLPLFPAPPNHQDQVHVALLLDQDDADPLQVHANEPQQQAQDVSVQPAVLNTLDADQPPDPFLLAALDIVDNTNDADHTQDMEHHPPLPQLHLVQLNFGEKSHLKVGDKVALVQAGEWCSDPHVTFRHQMLEIIASTDSLELHSSGWNQPRRELPVPRPGLGHAQGPPVGQWSQCGGHRLPTINSD